MAELRTTTIHYLVFENLYRKYYFKYIENITLKLTILLLYVHVYVALYHHCSLSSLTIRSFVYLN